MAKKKRKTASGRPIPYGSPEWERYQSKKSAERRKRGLVGRTRKESGNTSGTAGGKRGGQMNRMRGK